MVQEVFSWSLWFVRYGCQRRIRIRITIILADCIPLKVRRWRFPGLLSSSYARMSHHIVLHPCMQGTIINPPLCNLTCFCPFMPALHPHNSCRKWGGGGGGGGQGRSLHVGTLSLASKVSYVHCIVPTSSWEASFAGFRSYCRSSATFRLYDSIQRTTAIPT